MNSEKLFELGADLARIEAKSDPIRLTNEVGKVVKMPTPKTAIDNEELPLRVRMQLLEDLVAKLYDTIAPLPKQIDDLRAKIG